MPQSVSTNSKPDDSVLSTAFAALNNYDYGSSRAALLPIDEAVVASLADESIRKELETRLVSALRKGGSVTAREYLCSKLALMGTGSCVPAVAALLTTLELATAARNTLEGIPDRQAVKALRKSLSKVKGVQKIGVINSLGTRRDAGSVRVLSALLKDEDPAIGGAAAAALGNIATAKSARVLHEFLPTAPHTLQRQLADACLVCAERLLAAGRKADAASLYRLLTHIALPQDVQHAAARGLDLISRQR